MPEPIELLDELDRDMLLAVYEIAPALPPVVIQRWLEYGGHGPAEQGIGRRMLELENELADTRRQLGQVTEQRDIAREDRRLRTLERDRVTDERNRAQRGVDNLLSDLAAKSAELVVVTADRDRAVAALPPTGPHGGRRLAPGDRVNVVLDALVEVRDDRETFVVYGRVVNGEGESAPPVFPGARRNTWQTWLGVPSDNRPMGVFAIDLGPVVSSLTPDATLKIARRRAGQPQPNDAGKRGKASTGREADHA